MKKNRWTFNFALIQFLLIRSLQKICPWLYSCTVMAYTKYRCNIILLSSSSKGTDHYKNFAHHLTTVLSWHMLNFVVRIKCQQRNYSKTKLPSNLNYNWTKSVKWVQFCSILHQCYWMHLSSASCMNPLIWSSQQLLMPWHHVVPGHQQLLGWLIEIQKFNIS